MSAAAAIAMISTTLPAPCQSTGSGAGVWVGAPAVVEGVVWGAVVVDAGRGEGVVVAVTVGELEVAGDALVDVALGAKGSMKMLPSPDPICIMMGITTLTTAAAPIPQSTGPQRPERSEAAAPVTSISAPATTPKNFTMDRRLSEKPTRSDA